MESHRKVTTCNALRPKVLDVDQKIENLDEDILVFAETEINIDVFDERMESQRTIETEYQGFPEVITQIDDDYVSEAQDIKARNSFIKTAAAETTPLPSFKIRELQDI